MPNIAVRILNHPAPFHAFIIKVVIRKLRLGTYKFRVAIGAVDRPHYAYLIFNAAKLALKLGHKKISIIEYGVAGGNGLLKLEYHAMKIEKLFPIQIDIYGFDSGQGLPAPKDYRDLPYNWEQSLFKMDQEKLRGRLKKAKLVLGDVSATAKSFFEQYNPAPIGAIAYDLDFYSSTAEALKMLSADEKYFLPRIFCYFDDTIGDDIELNNDFSGERLAISEFNDRHQDIKVCRPYSFNIRGNESWHQKIWICHLFQHSKYNTFVNQENRQLNLNLKD